MLDLESEAMRGLGSIPTGGNILSLDIFHEVKPLIPILALLPIWSICEKPELSGNGLLDTDCFLDSIEFSEK